MRLRPSADSVILNISKGSASKGDDTHYHARIVQIVSKQYELLIGVTPPMYNLGGSQPLLQQWEIVSFGITEGVVRHNEIVITRF